MTPMRSCSNSARIYINGPVTDQIKFMFNTEYDGA